TRHANFSVRIKRQADAQGHCADGVLASQSGIVILQSHSHGLTGIVSQARGRTEAKADVWKDRFRVRAIYILVTKIRSPITELFGDLAIEAWGIEGARQPQGRVPDHQSFVQPLETGARENSMRRKDALTDSR